ncbi:hypothetical protein HDV01_004444, partial [Terramyces sp. JEL0728]
MSDLSIQLDINSDNETVTSEQTAAIVIPDPNAYYPNMLEESSVSGSDNDVGSPHFTEDSVTVDHENNIIPTLPITNEDFIEDSFSVYSYDYSTTSSDIDAYHESQSLCSPVSDSVPCQPLNPATRNQEMWSISTSVIHSKIPAYYQEEVCDTNQCHDEDEIGAAVNRNLIKRSILNEDYHYRESLPKSKKSRIQLSTEVKEASVNTQYDSQSADLIGKELSSDDLLTELFQTNKELPMLIESSKKNAAKQFIEWKTDLVEYYNTPFSLLTQSLRVDLSSLEKGQYWFSKDTIYPSTPIPSIEAETSNLIGLIVSEGINDDKYLIIPGRKKELLKVGFQLQINESITIAVFNSGIFALYDISRPSFTQVISGPSDLMLPYKEELVFTGVITPDMKFRVKIFGKNEVLEVDHYDDIFQVFYTDPVSKLQKIYPYRMLQLKT